MTVAKKGTTEAAEMATYEGFQKSNHKSVANNKEEEEEDSNSDRNKHTRDIAYWIGQPRGSPLRNEEEESEGEEEDVSATKSSTEDNSPINE